MNRFSTLLLSAALLSPLALHAQTAELTGRVGDVFADQFVLETDGQRILVEAPGQVPARGDIVSVTGTRDGANFAATGVRQAANGVSAEETTLPEELRGLGLTSIRDRMDDGERRVGGRLADGSELRIEYHRDGRIDEVETSRDGALPAQLLTRILPAALLDSAEYKGIARVTEVDIDRDEVKVEGFAENGAKVEIEASPEGAIHGYERKLDRDRRTMNEGAARERLAALGYGDAGRIRSDDGKLEVQATNPFGERVDLRLDEQGRVTRERAAD
ncbi:prevent-host-death protein [Cereibacter sp. SYSU M97828]|nr:prevent-host-death protein [Cereibacter flavus]